MNEPIVTQCNCSLTAIAPCFNEADVLSTFYGELTTVLSALDHIDYTITFIDDGSTDNTLALLNAIAETDPHVRVYSFSRNFGHQVALSAGLDVVCSDAVVMMDCDMQHPPTLIPEMVRLWREERYDIVSAVRETTAGAGIFKRFSAATFYRTINVLSNTSIVEGAADFCLLSRPACAALTSMPERHRFLRGMVSWIGFRRTYVRFHAPPRAAGESKYGMHKMMRLALDASFAFSSNPIRLATRLGIFVFLAGLLYLVYILARFFVAGDLVPGWGSLVCTLLLASGIQLVFIGLIGEYLSRVFDEVKQRPLYIFKQTPPTPPRESRHVDTRGSSPHDQVTHAR
ncbi:MAG: glycosyltransferase family 2 protein [Pirellulaceae bacterium]